MDTGSDIVLILPNDGDENFISVINVACGLTLIECIKSVSDLGIFSEISYTPSSIAIWEFLTNFSSICTKILQPPLV